MFLDAYISNGFNRREAVKTAGVKCGDPSAYGARILKREHVVTEMTKRLSKKKGKFFVSEQDIMEGLYKEAQLGKDDGGTQQGRVQAWVQLGKQMGMFNDKVRELEARAKGNNGPQIQIINYNTPTSRAIEKVVEDTKEALEHIAPSELPEGISVTNYADKEET